MTNRLLIHNEGLFISRPGYDVLTAPDIGMLFNSKMVNTRVLQKGTATVTDEQLVYFGIDYGFVPFFQFYWISGGVYYHSAASGAAQEIGAPGRPFASVWSDRFWINTPNQNAMTVYYTLMER